MEEKALALRALLSRKLRGSCHQLDGMGMDIGLPHPARCRGVRPDSSRAGFCTTEDTCGGGGERLVRKSTCNRG